MVGPDQIQLLGRQFDQGQAHQRCRKQVEARAVVGFDQVLQVLRIVLTVLPIKNVQGQGGFFEHQLERLNQMAGGPEAGAQDFMAFDDRLPGVGKARDIQAADCYGSLIDVSRRFGCFKGVEHHPLLHR